VTSVQVALQPSELDLVQTHPEIFQPPQLESGHCNRERVIGLPIPDVISAPSK